MFIAVDIPDRVKAAILERTRMLARDWAKPVTAGQMHITIFFLGYLDDARVGKVEELMSGLSARRFTISLAGLGTFPGREQRVVFAGIREGREALAEIHSRLLGPLSGLGIRMEQREFNPHLTVMRIKGTAAHMGETVEELISGSGGTEFGSFLCGSIRLKESVLGGHGAVHTEMFEKELSD